MSQSDTVTELGKEVLRVNIMGWFGLGLGWLVLFGTGFNPLLSFVGLVPAIGFFLWGIWVNRMFRAARAAQEEKE